MSQVAGGFALTGSGRELPVLETVVAGAVVALAGVTRVLLARNRRLASDARHAAWAEMVRHLPPGSRLCGSDGRTTVEIGRESSGER